MDFPTHHSALEKSAIYDPHYESSTLQIQDQNSVLMDIIFSYLEEHSPKEKPSFVSPVQLTPINKDVSKVRAWQESLAPYPLNASPPPLYNHFDEHSQSPGARTESTYSDSSIYSEQEGPKTPHTPIFASPLDHRTPMSAGYNSRNTPETPPRPLSTPPLDLFTFGSSIYEDRQSRRSSLRRAQGRLPIRRPFSFEKPLSPSPPPTMQANITSLVDDFMPEFVPSPPKNKRSNTGPLEATSHSQEEKISSLMKTPSAPTPSKIKPPPITGSVHVAQMISPGQIVAPKPVRGFAPAPNKKVIRHLEKRAAPARSAVPILSIPQPTAPRKPRTTSLEERNLAALMLSIPETVPNGTKEAEEVRKSSPLKIQRQPEALSKMTLRTTESEMEVSPKTVVKSTPMALKLVQSPVAITPRKDLEELPKIMPTAIQEDASAVPRIPGENREKKEPVPSQVETITERPVGLGVNLGGRWFNGGFFAGAQGLKIKMSRQVITMSKMEWVVEGPDESRLLKCYAQSNSLSRRKDFWDLDGNQIFEFQRKTGSTRIAQAPGGQILFAIKNAALYGSPHWTVNLVGPNDSSSIHWVARGDDALENLVVTWGGFEVGRISCESGFRKHTYNLTVAPEMNYCIMATLTTVFDDLRTDEGC